MAILLDHQLREQISRDISDFPVAFYCDELADLPNRAGPMHWHPYFEIATAQSGVLDYQVGQTHTILEPGDSIFVNQNMLHGIRQVSGAAPDPLPIIVFSGTVIAPENSAIYQNYIQPILACSSLPFVVFRQGNDLWNEVHRQIRAIYCAMRERPVCYELAVQRSLCCILEAVFRNLDSLPKSEASRVQLNAQIRLQKMLSYIYENYIRTITLADIAGAANISRSEAGRCFQAYLLPAGFIRSIISAASFTGNMDIHRGKNGVWVNNAFIWRHSSFCFGEFEYIIPSNSNTEGDLLWNSNG